MTFARFPESLDADEPTGKIYVFPIQLPDGASLSSAAVEPVDSSSAVVDPSPIVTVTEVMFGQESGQLWGVSFRVQGTGLSGHAYLRCRYVVSDGPQGDDITGVLLVRQR